MVTRHLAAAVQFVAPITSVYWWRGEINRTNEWLLFMMTPAARFDELVEAIKHHKATRNKERLKASENLTEHGLMFPTAFGNPSDPDTFSHLFSWL
ncbi:divalent cation tolerance protein CutA [Nonomuraea sp. NPDC049649]|uniref:divalent cation tolerance protein CutA n=1 Tax=Nonomuraea sp. NPDC049649 TaxID=3155776 RepID=UPI00341B248B